MIFLKQFIDAAKWVFGVFKVYVRKRPVTTSVAIGLSVLSRILHIAAFLMPLKVILLAGSDGVPRYFQFFITADNKPDWILWLAVASVVSYILTLVCEDLSERLSDSGSAGILKDVNKLALVGKQRAQARANYSKITQVVSSSVFAMVSMTVLAYINLAVFSVFSALVVIEFLFTAVVLSTGSMSRPGGVREFMTEDPGKYLQVLSSINFLGSFFVILMPFLTGGSGNIIMAILAFLLIRRALPAVKYVIVNGSNLYKERREIDPLVFRTRKAQRVENNERQTVRAFFDRGARQVLAATHMNAVCPDTQGVEVRWQDSPIKCVYTFIVSCQSGEGGKTAHYQQQVFPANQVHLLGREDLLFSTLKRPVLNAPAVVSRFQEGVFECQICEYGPGKPVSSGRYGEIYEKLMLNLCCFTPPKKLVSAFQTARASLSERLTAEFYERLAVAADMEAERASLETLQARLPELRQRIEQIPLHIYNPDISQKNVVELESGEIRTMTWVRWAIEPIGIGLSTKLLSSGLAGFLEQVNGRRKGLESPVTMKDIELVKAFSALEQKINQGKYKAALQAVRHVISHID